jgi:ubiquinone/menaquinone biosynthesis C-methylase UbiE
MNFVGSVNFDDVGRAFLNHFKDAGMKPHHRVLDVGCGVGRMALPLTGYLKQPGSFEGMDIVDVGIEWCQQNVTPRFPNFRFLTADVYNAAYHPTGKYLPCHYRFPYPSESFDFVYLASVFTHMRPADVDNYLSEIARVMKVGGKCLITFFFRNDEAVRYTAAGKSAFDFKHRLRGCWTTNLGSPEDAIAYEEPYVLRLYRRLGLTPENSIRYGLWCGRPNGYSGQDVIIATKTRKATPPVLKRLSRAAGRLRSEYWPGRRAVAEGSGVALVVERARKHARGEAA